MAVFGLYTQDSYHIAYEDMFPCGDSNQGDPYGPILSLRFTSYSPFASTPNKFGSELIV